tara:strand:+ start:3295 stop:3636 length:342 start_codon:yes stop_codon:yes gene_type:complete
MNDNMRKVLVALRSGEYKQARGVLQDTGGFCCLGVMCDVYERETGNKLKRTPSGLLYGTSLLYHVVVKEWVGLKANTGGSDSNEPLAAINDRSDSSFAYIADFIESEPQGLLV